MLNGTSRAVVLGRTVGTVNNTALDAGAVDKRITISATSTVVLSRTG